MIGAVGDRAVVVAGAGSNDTAKSVESVRVAEKVGANAVLAVTPYYNKPPQAGLVAHFLALADASDLPVMVYDIPGRSGIAIARETYLQIAEHERIVAVKDARADLWLKDVAPSDDLRRWFHHESPRFVEFARRYRAELDDNPAVGELRDVVGKHDVVTLLYGARDETENQAVVLRDYLTGEGAGAAGAG